MTTKKQLATQLAEMHGDGESAVRSYMQTMTKAELEHQLALSSTDDPAVKAKLWADYNSKNNK